MKKTSHSRRSFIKLVSAGGLASLSLPAGFLVGPSVAGASGARILTIAQGADILSLDPADHGNNSTESALVNIYDYLVAKDFSGNSLVFKPQLAVSWERESPVRWVFKLRDDVRWHDGSLFTAEDVKFTIERSLSDKKLRSSGKFAAIKQVAVLDDYTVAVETNEPDALLLHYFVGNGAGILPKQAFEKAGGKEAFFRQPVGTGPYRYQEWRKADRLVLTANPDWWGGAPTWEQVVIRAIPETATRVAEFITGGVDIATNIPPEDIARIQANAGTETLAFDIARNMALHVRAGGDWLTSDIRVRRAIDLAIDREALVSQVAEGYGVPTRGYFPAKIPGAHPGLNQNLAYDPERARALVREAGKEGASIKLSAPSGRWLKDREVAEAIVGYLEDIGLRPQLEILDWTIYNSRLRANGFGELYLWAMGSYTDGASLYTNDRGFSQHYEWHNDEYESIRAQVVNPPDEASRLALLHRAQEIVAEDAVRIGLLFPQVIYGVGQRVEFDGRFDEMIFAQEVRPA